MKILVPFASVEIAEFECIVLISSRMFPGISAMEWYKISS
jgi:hypothetical protein